MNESFTLNSVYTINTETQLNSFDRKVISALYQPIIGYEATSLYFTLCSEVEIDRVYSSQSYIKRLSKIMMMDLQRIKESFRCLEAIGLIKTYHKKEDNIDYYIFGIKSPEVPNSFFKNPLLVSNLKSSLGESDYYKTKMFFTYEEYEKSGYENVTSKYRDFFSLNCDLKEVDIDNTYKDYSYAKIESDFDFDILKEHLKQKNLQYLLVSNKIKNTFEMIMLTYKISISELVESIEDCYVNNKLDIDELIKLVALKDEIKNYKSALDLVYLSNDKANNKYEKNSVYDFIKKYSKTTIIDNDLLVKIERILKEYKLDYSVINVLIEYIVGYKSILDLNYLKVVAKQWQELKIKDYKQALEKIDSITNKTKISKKRNSYQKTIGNIEEYANDNTELDEEIIREFKEIVSQIK